MGDDTKDGQLDAAGIPELPADGCLDEVKPDVNSATAGDEKEDEITLNETADINEALSWPGKFSAEAGEDFTENGDDFDEEENRDANRHNGDDDRIHHRGFDLLAQAIGIFKIGREAGENFGEQTAFFTGRHHADIHPAEYFWMFLKRFGETVATLDARADVFDDVAHDFVGGLIGESLERLDHCETGVDHGGQLAGEYDQIH